VCAPPSYFSFPFFQAIQSPGLSTSSLSPPLFGLISYPTCRFFPSDSFRCDLEPLFHWSTICLIDVFCSPPCGFVFSVFFCPPYSLLFHHTQHAVTLLLFFEINALSAAVAFGHVPFSSPPFPVRWHAMPFFLFRYFLLVRCASLSRQVILPTLPRLGQTFFSRGAPTRSVFFSAIALFPHHSHYPLSSCRMAFLGSLPPPDRLKRLFFSCPLPTPPLPRTPPLRPFENFLIALCPTTLFLVQVPYPLRASGLRVFHPPRLSFTSPKYIFLFSSTPEWTPLPSFVQPPL